MAPGRWSRGWKANGDPVTRHCCVERSQVSSMWANVWDAELREMVVEVEGTDEVGTVDVSTDSTRFATGSDENTASIWSITSG